VLSGYVASAFAAHKVNGIQANMIRAGLEASTRIRASSKPETKSVENWSKYSVQSGKTKL
jgi:cell envelope opacity-associated protein A